MKQSQLFEHFKPRSVRRKTIDRYGENSLIDQTNGKFSFLIEEDSGSKSKKATRVSIGSRTISKGKIQ